MSPFHSRVCFCYGIMTNEMLRMQWMRWMEQFLMVGNLGVQMARYGRPSEPYRRGPPRGGGRRRR